MNDLILQIAIGLAVWRLTKLLLYNPPHSERGLFGLFDFIRKSLGENKIEYDEYSNPTYPNELIRMLSCLWCTSVTVGYCFAFAQYKTLSPLHIFVFGLTYSTIAIMIEKWLSRMR